MGSEISASLGERVQEHEVPIADAIEKVEELFWRIGVITSSLEEKRKLDFLQRIKSRFSLT